jgi:hypothetical protein
MRPEMDRCSRAQVGISLHRRGFAARFHLRQQATFTINEEGGLGVDFADRLVTTRLDNLNAIDRLAAVLKSLPVDNSVPPYLYLKPSREGVGRLNPNAVQTA